MAIHVLASLAHAQGDRLTSAELALSVNTNPVIIRRLLLALQRARLVETSQGAGAGSRLSRSPARINLADVYRAVEGSEPFARPNRKPNADCPVGSCILDALEPIFASAEQAIERSLAQTRLDGLLEKVHACTRGNRRKGKAF
jgi:Rrf2 family protein